MLFNQNKINEQMIVIKHRLEHYQKHYQKHHQTQTLQQIWHVKIQLYYLQQKTLL